jgi:hypothetical protein
MAVAACALASAIVSEAEKRAAVSGESATAIAAALALSGWKPSSMVTREARIVVARYHEDVKNDPAAAQLIIGGHRDGTGEIIQAKAAMRRAFEIAANWIDSASGDRTGVRFIEAMERESAA